MQIPEETQKCLHSGTDKTCYLHRGITTVNVPAPVVLLCYTYPLPRQYHVIWPTSPH